MCINYSVDVYACKAHILSLRFRCTYHKRGLSLYQSSILRTYCSASYLFFLICCTYFRCSHTLLHTNTTM